MYLLQIVIFKNEIIPYKSFNLNKFSSIIFVQEICNLFYKTITKLNFNYYRVEN